MILTSAFADTSWKSPRAALSQGSGYKAGLFTISGASGASLRKELEVLKETNQVVEIKPPKTAAKHAEPKARLFDSDFWTEPPETADKPQISEPAATTSPFKSDFWSAPNAMQDECRKHMEIRTERRDRSRLKILPGSYMSITLSAGSGRHLARELKQAYRGGHKITASASRASSNIRLTRGRAVSFERENNTTSIGLLHTISGAAGASLLKELNERKLNERKLLESSKKSSNNLEPRSWAVLQSTKTREGGGTNVTASITLSAGSGRHLARELKRHCAHHKKHAFDNSTSLAGLLSSSWASAEAKTDEEEDELSSSKSVLDLSFDEKAIIEEAIKACEVACEQQEQTPGQPRELLDTPGLSWKWEAEDDKLAKGKKCSTIGMFDSGVGGLTVYMELKKRFPYVNVVYFADMERQPYGPRQQTEVGEFCDEILHFMKRQGAGIGVIACNTATAATFDNQINERDKFADFPIFGTIPFAARAAMAHGSRVGVIATQGTCTSGAYARACGTEARCVQMPCPEFMALAEAGAVGEIHTKDVAMEYMQPCKGGNFDALIYGCTHYPILSDVVEDVLFKEFGELGVKMVDPAESLVDKMLEMMEACEGEPTTRFCVNKDPAGFAERASRILGYDVAAQCELVDLSR
jgi:glutamate racemase